MMIAFSYYPAWNESFFKAHNRKLNFLKYLIFSALACYGEMVTFKWRKQNFLTATLNAKKINSVYTSLK